MMLNEYIQNMKEDNDRKIAGLEQEMQELVDDLSCAEQMLEEMQRDKKVDTNIFSPRSLNQKLDEKIAEKQDEIHQLKQRMEYVTQMLEEDLKNREKIHDLKGELSAEQNLLKDNNSEEDTTKNNPVQEDETFMDQKETLAFLNTIYHKVETSLAFLNGNKNRSRTELNSCLKLIKEFAQKVENK